MTGIVFDGDQPRTTPFGPMMVALALRTSEMRIIDTWQSLGMRGTDSNDVAADGVFVPEARSFIVELPDCLVHQGYGAGSGEPAD